MHTLLTQLQEALGQTPLVLVQVDHTQGSVPREAGAWMAVTPDRVINTIGGGIWSSRPLMKPGPS